MPSPDAILHIGTEKTGSTSIQAAMAASREALLRHGFAYPHAPGETNHQRLALAAAEPQLVRDLARQETLAGNPEAAARLPQALAAEIAALPRGVHTVILSNEHCHSRLQDEDAVRRLHALLAPLFGRITILVYLRRQDELAVSRTSTALRTGRATPQVFPPGRRPRSYFDHAALLDRWGAVFGRDALRPRLFGAAHFAGGDLLEDWRAACGLGGVPLERPAAPLNPGLLPAAQDLLARFNRLAPRDQDRPHPAWIGEVLDARFAGPGRLPARAAAEAFVALHAEGNERIRREFFPHRAQLFDAEFSRYPEAETPPADDGAVLAVALAVIAHLSGLPVPDPDAAPEVPEAWAALRRAIEAAPGEGRLLRRALRLAGTPAELAETRAWLARARRSAPDDPLLGRLARQLRARLQSGEAGPD